MLFHHIQSTSKSVVFESDATVEPFDLISYGFNMFTAELSGSPILITNFTTSDIETVSLSDECSFDALEFSSALDSFSEYAEQVEIHHDDFKNLKIAHFVGRLAVLTCFDHVVSCSMCRMHSISRYIMMQCPTQPLAACRSIEHRPD